MEELYLIRPNAEYAEAIIECKNEYESAGSSLEGCGPLRRTNDPNEYLRFCAWEEDPASRSDSHVPATQFVLIRKNDNRVLGFLSLRHELNDYLARFGGHIGYSIRPSERRKGYAKEMFRLALPHCRALGLDRVLITCSDGNIGSERTILANGGVYESTASTDDKRLKRFWVLLDDQTKAMKRICELNDEMIINQSGASTRAPRQTARAIVLNGNGRYAVMHSLKFGLYSLPGGGIEENESIIAALHREITEETGGKINKIDGLGIVYENRASLDYTQINYYFIVSIDGIGKTNFTDAEKENKTMLEWHELSDVIHLINNQKFNSIQQKYLKARDVAALNAYCKKIECERTEPNGL